jgi:hypothetical protein
MKVLFIEAGPTMLAKNLLPIAKEMNKEKRSTIFVFLSIDILSHADIKKENIAIDQINKLENATYHTLKSLNPSIIQKYLRKENPNAVVFEAFRIYDMLWTVIAKNLGIRVYGCQHGFEIMNVYYKPEILINKFKKSIRVFFALYFLSKLLNKDFPKMLYRFAFYFFKGGELRDTDYDNKLLYPDHLFIYSNYYRMFWKKKFNLSYKTMTVTGPPDLMMVDEIKKKPKIAGCCYLAQTIVEDGRMPIKDFNNLLDEYKEISQGFEKFIIKMHPRGDRTLYAKLIKLGNVELVWEYPNCEYYLTHYSSTAFVAYYITPKVLLHELDGQPTPEIYKQFGFNIVSDSSQILSSFKDDTLFFKNKSNSILDNIAPIPNVHPNKKIAKLILNEK